ncbi:MAG TPA: valine--tRNA ligase [Candidatus Cloacimonadota bacterium]|nr:valine--tRNA ligase [Candidatus Cloacimonadota bacterium]HOV16101.1 valine--tRNA ligase [Candidatus Cloacimonadota bacterium]HQL14803.1 valine--tRNA ligase [Candidatus Cloacimonadota bacterium]
MEISKTYSPSQIEKKWYQFWSEKGYFTPKIDKAKTPFTVLMPPPNVTGVLHMGHVLNNTLQDIIVRYHRMLGEPTLWLPGVDHAGIATQNVVEKQLAAQGKTRHDIGREELVKLIWQWKEEKGDRIIEQLKQLGCSCDWTRQRFTMDDMLSEAVKEVFVRLYEEGLIYKGKYIINWCPRCVTALANDEVEHFEEEGKLWYFKYPYKDGSGFVTIATTRPETMLGDTAVAVNPNDERYKNLVGKELLLPLTDRTIPIIADDYVDINFGTGCVKVTPAHDPNDFEIGLRHDLPQLLVMDEYGKMNENAPAQFQGLDRYACREKIVQLMAEKGLLEKTEKHLLSVGHCYRCDTVIEPYLSDQWFVKMKPLSTAAVQAVETGEIKFQPERWTKVYMHWMNNIRDWCISRQIWWGHRIPAYYCENCGKMIVAKEMPSVCPDCGSCKFHQDEDVLDTWFSSWLWPFSTMGWPEDTEDQHYFLPTDILITAPEIIYLWVARMIMSTLHFKGIIPFETVLLHGTVRDERGRKMSKSLGNSPDPIDIIDRVGADALRFSMVFSTPKGADVFYSDAILETGRNFANKIWNAYRFIMMNAEAIKGLPAKEELELELADKWIYSRLNEVAKQTGNHYASLRFNDAAQALFKFIWDEFCSWYLELCKDRLYANESDSEPTQAALTAKYILLDVMQTSMRLLHPLMPFITEEIWQGIRNYFPLKEESIMITAFPKADKKLIDKAIADEMSFVQESIVAIRNLRKQVNLLPSLEVSVSVRLADAKQKDLFVRYESYFRKLAKVGTLNAEVGLTKPPASLAAVVRNIEIFLPLRGLIDIPQEKARLTKQLEKLEAELTTVEKKLANENFLQNAKPEVVAKEQARREEVNTKVQLTRNQISDLE